MVHAIAVIIIITILTITTSTAQETDHTRYAVVIDAGSSGTRLWVYKWEPVHFGLPKFEYMLKKRTNPGISEAASDSIELELKLTEMLSQAAGVVPSSKQETTSVYLLATAGMRYLLEDSAIEVIEVIHILLNNSTINPFRYVRNNIRILSGEEEGAFAWIAVNYMKGVFHSPSTEPPYKKTYGIIEMGGASTQIAFIPKGFLLAKLFPLTIAGQRFFLYSHSYLQMGQDAVEKWILDHLVEEAERRGDEESSIVNPCFNKGANVTRDGYNIQADSSNGNHHKCFEMLKKLVVKRPPRYCHPKPCGVGTVYQPSISKDQKFYGLSVYPLIFRELGLISKDHNGPVSIADLYNATINYCEKSFDELKVGVEEKRHKYLFKPCYMGLYLTRLLHEGYGFAKDTDSIYALEKINDRSVDWTLGALLYETQLEDNADSCPSSAFSIGSTGSILNPSSFSIFILAIALPLYNLFPFPAARITR